MLYVGIDPGITGGLAVLNMEDELIHVEKFSDFKTISQFFKDYKDEIILTGLEQVHGFPGMGVKTVTTFMKNAGGWECMLDILEIPYTLIPPSRWQKKILGVFPKGESKKRALSYVQKRFPKVGVKKSDSGIVDAICIALAIKTKDN